MNNEAIYSLVGVDEENAFFKCSFCGNIIPVELDENGDIQLADVYDVCPECDADVIDIDLN